MPEEPPWPAALERGEAGAPLAGETRTGDLAVFAPYEGGALVAVIDGLGHGGAAADASEAAAAILSERPDDPPDVLLKRCHDALRSTRGVVATLAWFDLGSACLQLDGDRQRRGPARAREPPARGLRRLPHAVRRRARLVPAGRARGDDRARPRRLPRDGHRRRRRRLRLVPGAGRARAGAGEAHPGLARPRLRRRAGRRRALPAQWARSGPAATTSAPRSSRSSTPPPRPTAA